MHQLTLPKHARVLKRKQFLYITRSGFCCRGSQVTFYVTPSRYSGNCKVGITVSKKFGKAHERNYFKRLVREAFRHVRHQLPNCQIVVFPKAHKHQPIFFKLLEDFVSQIPEGMSRFKKIKATTGDECIPKNEKCANAPH
ncbi:Ribonuclease P protein component,ribonuclease P,ribonuclease P protein component,Ribonuclease P [Chlamydia serpentis]|uniref:Ribonuclease P protein component n=1 Tax=Chlamydia serpentis TaxID=1967782 RepID=A0A2R8FCH7_9CHLA|nr:ribonuclease P protein component [Chlamydia serpentis]SPN74042.1 Ribonuclease P protein component,ribonuclease P,ribonuclease P protein component,Ribonuclease P [Chlamydia serpentis]